MEDPDPFVRSRAANAWCAWEDAVVPLENAKPNAKPNAYSDRPPAALLTFVRICAHYSPRARGWRTAPCCATPDTWPGAIPGVLIHGRLDMSGPLHTAWELARAWPDAELVTLRDSGHQGSDTKREQMLGALDIFARH
jgi:proline iminopeptidase